MLDSKKTDQLQNAGDHALQMQGCSITINQYYGDKNMTREEAQSISQSLATGQNANPVLQNEAVRFQQNASRLNDLTIPKIEQGGMLGAFGDPGFLTVLYSAYKAAMLSQREKDFELLSETLAMRAKHPRVDEVKIATEKAVDIVKDVSDEALCGLTCLYMLHRIVPVFGQISLGLDVYAEKLSKLVPSLPRGDNWLEQLDMLGAMRLSVIHVGVKDFSQVLAALLVGYTVKGLKAGSEEFSRSLEQLADQHLPQELLIPHELNPSYMRLPVVHEEELFQEKITLYLPHEGGIREFVCSEAGQRQVLQDIYRHTLEGPVALDKVIKENLAREIEKRPPLQECGKWWAQIPQGFRLNTAGYVLGYAYGKQLFADFPDWL